MRKKWDWQWISWKLRVGQERAAGQQAWSKGVVEPLRGIVGISAADLGRRGQQVAHSDQVVGRQCEGEHPTDAVDAAMASLAQAPDGLEPAEDFFHPFAFLLTNRVARMTSGALVDNTALLARKMRSYLMLAQGLNQLLAVVALVGAQGYPMPARELFQQRQRSLRFSAAGGLSYPAVDRQPVAILHQHVTGVAELGLLARALAGQARLGIGSRLVGVIGARFAVKVDAGVAGIVRRRLGLSVFALEALVPGPRLDQRAIDR